MKKLFIICALLGLIVAYLYWKYIKMPNVFDEDPKEIAKNISVITIVLGSLW